ncbi:hypothetical protein J5N97_028023 [Dioscorea zingiberensis]|uniref:protein disulfide-isomerase n=1 Tax=Dioscorea zingiberensis TaxID=325984 RepID=A0A9D5BXW8_9LILI|nr:hypothetical protein J5N97_028023 [Dioscorea zingiberensis]
MALRKQSSRAISIAILLSLLLLTASSSDDDLDDLEELLAIDEEEEKRGSVAQVKPSEADVLSRAQRIVLELTNENVQRVIDGNELVLLLGYAPWCPRSAELMPRFAEAATVLREMGSKVVMAKLDADRHAKAASSLGIKGFPTLLLFVNGSAQSYTGGFTGEEIVIWTRKKTGAPVLRLTSIAEAEEFLQSHQIFVIGFFDHFEFTTEYLIYLFSRGVEYEEFLKAATTDNEIQFVEANAFNIAKVLFPDIGAEKQFIGLVKNESEKFEKFKVCEGRILQFVDYNKFPLLTTLTELNSARVYSSPIKTQIFIFAEAGDIEQLRLSLQDVARKFKSKIMFVYVDSAEDNLAKPFLTLLGLESDHPIVAAFDNRDGSKYVLETDLTPQNLEEFCSGLLHGTLSQYYKSEPKPDVSGLIEKVVSKTFDSSVLESSENVFLEVYTPWCIDCDATSKQIEKLAKHFEGVDNLKFGRYDASLNENPNLQINNYPTLLFYPAGDKFNPIKLSKKSSLKELVSFINEKVKIEDGRGAMTVDQEKKDEL